LNEREERELRNNVTVRIRTMLDNIEKLESSNFGKVNNKIIQDAINDLDNSVKDPKIHQQSFDFAIDILKNIQNKDRKKPTDPLTKVVNDTLNKSRNDFESLSEDEKNKLIYLTTDQIQTLKDNDTALKNTYVNKKVEIHSDAIKASDIYKEVQRKME